VKYGADFGSGKTVRVNLFEQLAVTGRKSVLTGVIPDDPSLIAGNLSVDPSGNNEKYQGSDFHLVLGKWSRDYNTPS
jgi:hypothetical protein